MSKKTRKLASIKPREALRVLERAGWFIHRTIGSHVHLKHYQKPGRITVPYHAGFDLPKGTIKRIINQAGLTNEEFLDLLGK